MEFFKKEKLEERYKEIMGSHQYTIEMVNEDFRLIYVHFPLDKKKDYFAFFGIAPGKNFRECLAREKTLENIIKKINELFPKMDPADWGSYKVLTENATMASLRRCYTSNEETRTDEDVKIKLLCDFCKEHEIGC